ncbi:hypothetical protein EVA_07248 [gut metagenome]|uniref:Uncharacterized protein n=1 Tax=gut metagenome TaxID=749906 RepID=J9CWM6_9ZZZZ
MIDQCCNRSTCSARCSRKSFLAKASSPDLIASSRARS